MSESLSNAEQLTPEVLEEMRELRERLRKTEPPCGCFDMLCKVCSERVEVQQRMRELAQDNAESLIAAAEREQARADVDELNLIEHVTLVGKLEQVEKRIAELEALLDRAWHMKGETKACVSECVACEWDGMKRHEVRTLKGEQQ